ncbi:MAG: penicillin-binding protein 2 [Candidatus Bipolaricaulota bacterium]|nr:penicillin-binding protein 2 [Candidatus Bipolaricaulota bacterium]
MRSGPGTSSSKGEAVNRAALPFLVLALGGLVVVGRLVQLQVVEHRRWSALAQAIQEDRIEVPARRGTIYDRNGVPLVYDVPAYEIALDNTLVTKPELLVDLLVKELGLSRAEARDKVYRQAYFTWLARGVDYAVGKRIQGEAKAQGIRGLLFFDSWKRAYPQGPLALAVLGVVGVDGHGLAGLELLFDERLAGRPRVVRLLRGPGGQVYDLWEEDPGAAGKDLRLTLDHRIQWVCEREIARGLATYPGADRGFALVMDPRTGEVLALAHGPAPDPNKPDPNLLIPWSVTHVFEPGSTFKALVGLAALDQGLIAPDEVFSGDSPILVGRTPVKNARGKSYGPITFRRAMAESVNTVLVQVAQRLGIEKTHAYLTRMGFGQKTGIELPGEVAGIVNPKEKWTELDLAVASFGQGVAVTGIQLGAAYAAMANGGTLLRPHLLPGPPEPRGRIASPEACRTMREILGYTVNVGTGTPAAVKGFNVGGKSGTAEMAVPGRGYLPDHVTTGMAAFFPWEAPEYTVLVIYQTTRNPEFWSGTTAVPSVGQIVRGMANLGIIRPYEPTTALGRSG